MKLSVIIPVYNEEEDIASCLSSLKNQTIKSEIIIVDDGSTDRTLEIARKFKVKILKQDHKGPGAARNLGARNSRGEILIFVDADMTFERDYLKNLIKPLKDKRIIGTTHSKEVASNIDNIWSRCWGRVRVSKKDDVKIFRAIRKSEFLKLGGFDSKHGYADDQTFWFKYKIKPVFADATCYHKNPSSLNEVYRQSIWIGASLDNIFLRSKFTKYFVPAAMIIISPVAIPILAIKKCHKNHDFAISPAMLVFMISRYLGTIKGIFRKIYLGKNYK